MNHWKNERYHQSSGWKIATHPNITDVRIRACLCNIEILALKILLNKMLVSFTCMLCKTSRSSVSCHFSGRAELETTVKFRKKVVSFKFLSRLRFLEISNKT